MVLLSGRNDRPASDKRHSKSFFVIGASDQ
jgi:hypothetical protein